MSTFAGMAGVDPGVVVGLEVAREAVDREVAAFAPVVVFLTAEAGFGRLVFREWALR